LSDGSAFITENDAQDFWSLRLKMLEEEPDSFLATLEEEINKPLEKVIVRFRETWSTNENYIIGAFIEGNLIGCAGFEREQRKKLRHKGNVWGMYVIPDLRGQGVGGLLLREIIKQSGSLESLEQLNLAVISDNLPAKSLYQSTGFVTYGVETRALKVGSYYMDEDLMVLKTS
jgi:ribosomal protein S18 acetylase RimI-like enzyme